MNKSEVKKKKPTRTIDPGESGDPVITEDDFAQKDQTSSSHENAEQETDAQNSDPVMLLQNKVNQLEDSLLRAKADFQNLQRRTAIEKSEAIQYANAEIMKSLLTIIDDFNRSFEAMDTSNQKDDSDTSGFRLIYENFIKALSQHGLVMIDALHKPFDPAIHEALLQQPCDEHPPGTVIEELARGYRLHARVIRPSRVIVSKAVESQNEDQAKSDPVDNETQPTPQE